jgi:hypothetical protein
MSTEDAPTIPLPARPPRSPLLAAWGVLTGLLTVLVGLLWMLLGIGFSNATAAGTGAAAVFVGGWMVFAVRGVARRRSVTFLGLGLAWLWLLARIALDLDAVATSSIVVLFLVPAVGVCLGAAWLAAWCSGGLVALVRAIGILRRRESSAGTAVRPTLPAAIGLAVRLGLLAVVTLGVPPLVWMDRQEKIAALARQYAAGPQTRSVTFGACTPVFLGYELTQHGADSARTEERRQAICETTLADAGADLAAIAAAGARYVRLGASGDQLLENKPDQEAIDDRCLAAVRRTGIPLVLVDTQHPKVTQKRKLDWFEFCRFQRDRIEYYQRRYRPAVYFVVCEPTSYHQFVLDRQTEFSADAWAEQLSAMCRLVKSIDRGTRTGICLLVMDDREPEWEVWSRMQQLPELDVLSVEIYEPEQFPKTELRLEKYGHPRRFGKSFWIAETYNGWALCGKRRWDQDAAWLRVAADFARRTDAEAVLVWTFGTFIPGGSFWDFGSGRLQRRWEENRQLSPVGETFAELAGRR